MIRPGLPPAPTGAFGSIPRLGILHAEGKYTLNDLEVEPHRLTNVILLGLIRQRSYWEHEGNILRCKSYDFEHGMPGPEFPWSESNFEPPTEGMSTLLPCGSCIFKDFVADPSTRSGWRAAPCYEQFVVPLLVPRDAGVSDFPLTVIDYTLAVAMFQKSSMKPIQEYLRRFSKENLPGYSKTTSLGLNINLGGTFKYSVPTFTRKDDVDARAYPSLSALLASARGTLTTPPDPKPAKTGGMLSVSTDAETATGYSGSFFS